jgi:hypothetical protein
MGRQPDGLEAWQGRHRADSKRPRWFLGYALVLAFTIDKGL